MNAWEYQFHFKITYVQFQFHESVNSWDRANICYRSQWSYKIHQIFIIDVQTYDKSNKFRARYSFLYFDKQWTLFFSLKFQLLTIIMSNWGEKNPRTLLHNSSSHKMKLLALDFQLGKLKIRSQSNHLMTDSICWDIVHEYMRSNCNLKLFERICCGHLKEKNCGKIERLRQWVSIALHLN